MHANPANDKISVIAHSLVDVTFRHYMVDVRFRHCLINVTMSTTDADDDDDGLSLIVFCLPWGDFDLTLTHLLLQS